MIPLDGSSKIIIYGTHHLFLSTNGVYILEGFTKSGFQIPLLKEYTVQKLDLVPELNVHHLGLQEPRRWNDIIALIPTESYQVEFQGKMVFQFFGGLIQAVSLASGVRIIM